MSSIITPVIGAQSPRRILGGVEIQNTAQPITNEFKICALVYAGSGFGKTTFGATMDRMTRRYGGKPTLVIAVEAGEGGGTMSIRDAGVDFVIPQSMEKLTALVAALGSDTTYGGIVFDSATEYVKRYLQPYALTFPSREGIPTRAAGVPERSDYQTMGEKARQFFNQLVALTTEAVGPKVRKHLMVTALEREKTDKNGTVIAIQPDLPGAMASTATAMFQTVGSIAMKAVVVPDPQDPKKMVRTMKRVWVTTADGVRNVKDRTKLLPMECELDWEMIWEKYVVPKIVV